ncbi:MAG TPA: protein kinase [Polyangiaceae bacterium]|nr:protein kinase [Polyangiaceae bacterium]
MLDPAAPPSALRVTTGQDTTAGAKPINEDSMGLLVPDEQELLQTKGICAIIADGVSAAEAGREAAETCVQTFLGDYFSTPDTWTVATSAQKVLTSLNNWLHGKSNAFVDAQKGYVCTLSILVIKSCTAHVFHVGDTRIWRKRAGTLEQLTKDHTVAVSKDQQFLSRAMGLDSNIAVDFRKDPVEPGDVFLLTSDGVHGSLDAAQLSALLGENGAGEQASLDENCRAIVAAAIAAGSPDNATCQLVRVETVPDASMDEYLNRLTELRFPPDLEPGHVIDGLRVEREIFSGPRCQVYQVRSVDSGQLYALKTPSVNFEDDPGYIERFSLEYWLGQRVKNEHLVRAITTEKPRTFLYNLMEYVDGPTLGTWIRRQERKRIRPPEEVVALIAQVVKGLYALHRKEIIHQDLKPDNVIIDANGVVKLIDYGSCAVSGIAEISVPLERERALGTRGYSAPEYVLGGAITPLADQFSLGVLTYEMLTGKLPYGEAIERAGTRREFDELTYTPAYVHNPRVAVWMDGALRKALSLQARNRYQELSEFLYDLEHPNPDYLKSLEDPQNARSFEWRWLALVLLFTQLASLGLMAHHWWMVHH